MHAATKQKRKADAATLFAQQTLLKQQKRDEAKAKVDAAVREVKEYGKHFSKIAARFAFKSTASAYTSWVVQFRSELECYDLLDVLTTNPEDDMEEGTDHVERAQQKAVYHMILQCVPSEARAAVTLTLPVSQHHAYGAWAALRQLYIGNEEAYLEGLEKKFSKLRWVDSEQFSEFELRYETLLSELAMVGVPKLEHVKKSALMGAIEESTKKDARGVHVFDRLNTVNLIHTREPYTEWLSSVRTEAQQIQEAVQNTRGKGAAASRSDDTPREVSSMSVSDSSAVSGAGQNSTKGAPNNSQGQGRKFVVVRRRQNDRGGAAGSGGGGSSGATLCRNWQRSGNCSYGASCRFSHEGAGQGGAQRAQPSSSAPAAGSGGAGKGSCWQFLASGTCRRGASCSFDHSRGGGAGARPNGTDANSIHMDGIAPEYEDGQRS